MFATPRKALGLIGALRRIKAGELKRKEMAWHRAHPIQGYDPCFVRADDFGATIAWDAHGDRNSKFGWEIDHILPTALGGSDRVENLRALHFRNNAALGGRLGSVLKDLRG